MELAGRGRLHAAKVGACLCSGPASALGETLRHRSTDTGAGPSGSFVAFGGAGHAGEGAETLRQVARETQRPPFWPSETLPGHQNDCLRRRRGRTRGIFAMSFVSIAKSSWLKRKLRGCANTEAAIQRLATLRVLNGLL